MKKIMVVLPIANQVLFFFGALIVIGLLLKPLFSSFFKSDYTPPKIQVIDKEGSKNNGIEVEYQIEFDRDIMDVFVFDISANAIVTKQEDKVLQMFNYVNNLKTVNLLFVPKSGQSYNLMENNAYIIRTSLYDQSNNAPQKLSKNLYLIVTNDTTEDGFLSEKDSADLQISDYNGKNRSIVLKDVDNYEVIQEDVILIEKNWAKKKYFTHMMY
jgi:hypothetical protein